MRQQEGIDDNDVQLNRGDHEEVDHESAGHEEVDHDHEEIFDQKEDRYRRRSVCFSISYSVTARFAALGRRAQLSARAHLIDGRPRCLA